MLPLLPIPQRANVLCVNMRRKLLHQRYAEKRLEKAFLCFFLLSFLSTYANTFFSLSLRENCARELKLVKMPTLGGRRARLKKSERRN